MERPSDSEHQVAPESIPGPPQGELRTLLFVSVNCRATQTEAELLSLTQRHATVVRETMGKFKGGEEIGRFGESFFLLFTKPVAAVKFSLQLLANIRTLAEEIHRPAFEQISLDLVEVAAPDAPRAVEGEHAYEKHAPVCRALAGFSKGNQILLTRPVFDEVRVTLKKEDLKPFGSFSWFNHGPCRVAGSEMPIEVAELREGTDASDAPPGGLERVPPRGDEAAPVVWGWRPGPGSAIPGSRYALDEKFTDGRFGEEWTGGEPNVKERRLFKFCFRKDWVSQLKEQDAVIQAVKKKIGQSPNVLSIQAVSLEQPPYYLATEFFEGKDLVSWARDRGGAPGIPFPTRLELMAQVAAGLQAAHEARILHRCLRPENILVTGAGMTPKEVQVKLTHFGVGHVALSPPKEEAVPHHEAHPVAPGETPPPSLEDMYKAPEVIAGQEPNAKSDVYSFGVILCQLVLGHLSEPLTSKRMTEIVGVLKKDSLATLFAADPPARAEGTGRAAGDLRSVIKEREARVTWQGQTSRRQIIERIAMAALSVIALAVLAYYGPKYLRRHKAQDPKKDAKKKPGDKASGGKDSDDGKLMSEESRDAKSNSEEDEETSNGQTTRRRPASAVRDKKKEEVKQSAESFFRLIVLPIALVIVLGTVVQQFGPRIKKFFHKGSPS